MTRNRSVRDLRRNPYRVPTVFERLFAFRLSFLPLMMSLCCMSACDHSEKSSSVAQQASPKVATLPSVPPGTTAFFPVRQGKRFGVIDARGNTLVRPTFKKVSQATISRGGIVSPFSGQQHLLLIGPRPEWILLSPEGAIAVAPLMESHQVARVLNYGEKLFGVFEWQKRGAAPPAFIDPTGRWTPVWEMIPTQPFREGLIAVKVDGKGGYADRTGSLVIPARFQRCESFFGGLAAAQQPQGLWGFISPTGEWSIEPRFSSVSSFDGDFALVREADQKYATLIDRQGNAVETFGYQYEAPPSGTFPGFVNGLMFVCRRDTPESDLKCGVLQQDGSWLYPPNLKRGGSSVFSEDRAIAIAPSTDGGQIAFSTLLSSSGTYVRRVPNGNWNPYRHGLSGDALGREGYLDRTGKTVWRPKR